MLDRLVQTRANRYDSLWMLNFSVTGGGLDLPEEAKQIIGSFQCLEPWAGKN